MQRFVAQSQQPSAVELWDAGGHRALATVNAPPPLDAPAAHGLVGAVAGNDSAAVGPLRLEGDTLVFALLVPIVDGTRVTAYAIERRHVATNPTTALQLAGLIGSDATLYIGNARGDLWTDFWKRVEPPPVDPAGRRGVLQYERHGSPQLARALSVASTPWLVLVEFPRDPVLARARAFLSRAALFALLLLGVGAAAVWAISRQITRPLRELTDAAAAVTSGDYSRHVDVAREDELGRLAHAFNLMAQRVGDAQHTLERAVTERTRELREAIAELESFSYSVSHDVVDELRRLDGAPPREIVIAPLPPATGDRGLVRQVLVNLIGNAFKFTRGRPDARVQIGAREDDAGPVYYVQDNGVGFDMRYADKLFGVFQRLHGAEQFEGTGVGLALVQRIIHRHGGRVWAEGKVNEGATFYFTLPQKPVTV